jgi:2,3-bisphosphoglycerate-dependent phosphoglycerate mutase
MKKIISYILLVILSLAVVSFCKNNFFKNIDYCEVYLIRHGETDSNVQGIIQGHENTPLNSKGIEQAKELQKKLKNVAFSAIFSSDLDRAYDTAKIVRGERRLEIQKAPDLRERSLKKWEGHTRKEVENVAKSQGLEVSKLSLDEFCSYKLPPGDIESVNDIYNRFKRFIRANVVSHLGEKVLLSSHGGVLKSVLYKTEGFSKDKKFWSASNCAYLVLHVFENGNIEIVKKDGIKTNDYAPYP